MVEDNSGFWSSSLKNHNHHLHYRCSFAGLTLQDPGSDPLLPVQCCAGIDHLIRIYHQDFVHQQPSFIHFIILFIGNKQL